MKYRNSILGLAAGTALLLAGGCSKQESPATPGAESASLSPAPVAAEKQQAVEAKASASVTAVPAPATNGVAAQPQKPATNQPASTPAGSGGTVTGIPASTLQSALRAQQLSLAQTATNQLRMLAAAGTNQVLTALGTTNQIALSATNQVAMLLERAKVLSANQKYQEALNTLTQVYNTKLTPEQKQKADDLKNQVQAALTQKAASGVSSALGNILGGKK